MTPRQIQDLAHEIRKIRTEKGFYTPDSCDGFDSNLMLGKLMLVVTEISEVSEQEDELLKSEEIADIIIRCLDILSTIGTDIKYWYPYAETSTGSWNGVPLIALVNLASKAAEAARHGRFEKDYLLEMVVLCCQLNAQLKNGTDIWNVVKWKVEKNKSRPAKHGKVSIL